VVDTKRINDLSIVTLKVARTGIDNARATLQLAEPLRSAGSDPRSLWFGPDRWLLVSDTKSAAEIVDLCNQALADITHNAVDYSAGLAVTRITGPEANEILATGTGVDFRLGKFPVGSCCRTKLGQIAAVIVAVAPETFDVYVDRSVATYLADWLARSSSIYLSYA